MVCRGRGEVSRADPLRIGHWHTLGWSLLGLLRLLLRLGLLRLLLGLVLSVQGCCQGWRKVEVGEVRQGAGVVGNGDVDARVLFW